MDPDARETTCCAKNADIQYFHTGPILAQAKLQNVVSVLATDTVDRQAKAILTGVVETGGLPGASEKRRHRCALLMLPCAAFEALISRSGPAAHGSAGCF